jgi:hypothetical protein
MLPGVSARAADFRWRLIARGESRGAAPASMFTGVNQRVVAWNCPGHSNSATAVRNIEFTALEVALRNHAFRPSTAMTTTTEVL